MITIRHGKEHGVANFDGLESKHTFSFKHCYDPWPMGFGPLRVINEDRVQPGRGFIPSGGVSSVLPRQSELVQPATMNSTTKASA